MSDGSAQARILAQQLARVPVELQRAMRPAISKAAAPIVSDAKARASWSSRIPGAIKATTSFSNSKPGVTIRASARIAPHARPYEGVTGSGTFRHPVFGDRDTWVSQATRPFLFPAVQGHRDQVVDEVEGAVTDTLRRNGFG